MRVTQLLTLIAAIITSAMDVPTKYKCCACSDYISDIGEHLIVSDHTGPFKIGLLSTDISNQSGYVSLKFKNYNFEQLRKYSLDGYQIAITEEKKLSISKRTNVDLPKQPADDPKFETDAEKNYIRNFWPYYQQ